MNEGKYLDKVIEFLDVYCDLYLYVDRNIDEKEVYSPNWVYKYILKRNYVNSSSIKLLLTFLKDDSDFKISIYILERTIVIDLLMFYYLEFFQHDSESYKNELKVLDSALLKSMIEYAIKGHSELGQSQADNLEKIALSWQISHADLFDKAGIKDIKDLEKNVKKVGAIRKESKYRPTGKCTTERDRFEYIMKHPSFHNKQVKSRLTDLYMNFKYFSQYQHFSPNSTLFIAESNFNSEKTQLVQPIIEMYNVLVLIISITLPKQNAEITILVDRCRSLIDDILPIE